jgi:hypothetical protein
VHRTGAAIGIASLSLIAIAVTPTASAAAPSGDHFTHLSAPGSVVTGSQWTVTATLVDGSGNPKPNGYFLVAVKSPASGCSPAACVPLAYGSYADANGNIKLSQSAELDTAVVLYPTTDDGFTPDPTAAVPFTIHAHNSYRWKGGLTHAKVPALMTTKLSLDAKDSAIANTPGAATPRTQVSRDGGKHWRTLANGPDKGALFGFGQYSSSPSILSASKPGHYLVRILDLPGKYERAAKSQPVKLRVTKRKTPAWLSRTNHYRHSIGLQNVFESKALDAADRKHAKWTARNQTLCHCEPKGSPGYSKKGDKAGLHSVIELGVGRAVGAVDLWMGAPFHATCLLNPAWSVGGFALSGDAAAEWCIAGKQVVDVASAHGAVQPGLDAAQTFPSRHMKVPTSLLANAGESPDPRTSCPGHWPSWTVPVLFRVAHPPKSDPHLKHVSARLTRGHHKIGPTCVFSGSTFHSSDGYSQILVRQILSAGPWVVLLARPTLHRGATYRAKLTDGHYTQKTTFTIAH